MLQYTCNKCQRGDVDYGDWLPIVPKVHWCRTCVTNYFDELPGSEMERAAHWRDRDWDKMTSKQREEYFQRTANRNAAELAREFLSELPDSSLPPVSLWQRLKCRIGLHRWFRETSTASYCLYCHKYRKE